MRLELRGQQPERQHGKDRDRVEQPLHNDRAECRRTGDAEAPPDIIRAEQFAEPGRQDVVDGIGDNETLGDLRKADRAAGAEQNPPADDADRNAGSIHRDRDQHKVKPGTLEGRR
jgi:hypothetical protein